MFYIVKDELILASPEPAHKSKITSVFYMTTPDAQHFFITGSEDHSIKVWRPNAANSFDLLETYDTGDVVNCVKVYQGSTTLIVAGLN